MPKISQFEPKNAVNNNIQPIWAQDAKSESRMLRTTTFLQSDGHDLQIWCPKSDAQDAKSVEFHFAKNDVQENVRIGVSISDFRTFGTCVAWCYKPGPTYTY